MNGFCDFIVSQSPEQLFLDTPILAVVEAKNERIASGLGQCVAEMVAAKIYNERESRPLPVLYGAVTTGQAWKFLQLQGAPVYIYIADYYINNSEKIMAILAGIVER